VAKRNYYPLATVANKKKMSTANTAYTLNINKEHKAVESSKLYYLIN
jgi:hypothetical protein